MVMDELFAARNNSDNVNVSDLITTLSSYQLFQVKLIYRLLRRGGIKSNYHCIQNGENCATQMQSFLGRIYLERICNNSILNFGVNLVTLVDSEVTLDIKEALSNETNI